MPSMNWNALKTRDMAYLLQVEPRRIQYYKDAGLLIPRVQAEGTRGKPILYNRRNLVEAFAIWILRDMCDHSIPVIRAVLKRISSSNDKRVFEITPDEYLIELMPVLPEGMKSAHPKWAIQGINENAQQLAERIATDFDTPSFKITNLHWVAQKAKELAGYPR